LDEFFNLADGGGKGDSKSKKLKKLYKNQRHRMSNGVNEFMDSFDMDAKAVLPILSPLGWHCGCVIALHTLRC
jgi:hypothetical protein